MEQSIKVRHYEETDMPEIKKWAEARKVMIFEDMLPRMGAVAYDANTGENLSCGWLYMDNSVGVAFPHWLLANPKNTIGVSRKAIKLMGEWMEFQAELLNYTAFCTFFEEGLMVEEAKRNGWNLVGAGQAIMLKILKK